MEPRVDEDRDGHMDRRVNGHTDRHGWRYQWVVARTEEYMYAGTDTQKDTDMDTDAGRGEKEERRRNQSWSG